MQPSSSSFWRRNLRELGEACLDLVCPLSCAACSAGIDAGELCELCASGLIGPRPPLCQRCGMPRPSRETSCPHSHEPLRGLAAAGHAFEYRGTGGALVRRLKFNHDPCAGKLLLKAMLWPLRENMRQRQASRFVRCSALVSVPLHRRKLRHRGMDQAAFLAEGLAQNSGLPYLPAVLRRLRDTMPQGDPRVSSRAQNIAEAFSLRRARAVVGKRIVLVDDVYTSGSTARECARLLREGGCREVLLITAAKS